MGARIRTAAAIVAVAVLAGVGLDTPVNAAMGNVRQSTSPAAVPGSYLVVLHTPDATFATRQATKRPIKIIRGYREAVAGFVMQTDSGAAAKLAEHPDVAFVEQDQLMHVTGASPALAEAVSAGGEGVHVYIVDTASRDGGPDLVGSVVGSVDGSVDGSVGGSTVDSDCHGHGTRIAATVAAVAGKAGIVGVRVLGCSGEGPVSTVIAGIDWVIANAQRPAVLNLALGGSPSDATDLAVRRAIAAGLTVVVTADDESACTTSPSRSGALVVGDPGRSTGCLDVSAPRMASGAGDEVATEANPALVTGQAALLLAAHPTWTHDQVRRQMISFYGRR